jgi:hypothetical protein
MRTQLASEVRRVCVAHPERDAVAVRVTTVGKGAKVPPQIARAKVCEACASVKVKKQAGVEVRVLPLK